MKTFISNFSRILNSRLIILNNFECSVHSPVVKRDKAEFGCDVFLQSY